MKERSPGDAGSLDPRLLNMLACPVCKGPLTADSLLSTLHCSRCSLTYRIDAGIPILIERRALEREADHA